MRFLKWFFKKEEPVVYDDLMLLDGDRVKSILMNAATAHEKLSNYADVGEFHDKFGLPSSFTRESKSPVMLDDETYAFRKGFMQEELDEFVEGYAEGDMSKMADALIDLVYVAMGTAHFMNLPWEELWDDVQRANMTKERATSAGDSRSKRKSSLDVVKPEGWVGPKTYEILSAYGHVPAGIKKELDHLSEEILKCMKVEGPAEVSAVEKPTKPKRVRKPSQKSAKPKASKRTNKKAQ